MTNFRTSGAFSTNGDLRNISSKQANVALYPLQSEGLVKEASIDSSVSPDLVRRQEAKCSQLGMPSAPLYGVIFEIGPLLESTHTVLNRNTNEAVIICVDDCT